MPRIVVLLNEETSFELTKFPAVLGRSPDCDIQVDNAQVSRRHAQVLEQSGQYFIECLGAANRTAVNGKLLELKERSAIPLQHNDRIKLGPVRLRFEADGSVPEPVAATSGGFELDDNSSATIMGSSAARGFGVFEVRPEEKLRGILKINQSLAGQVELTEIAPRILDVLFDIFPQADRGSIQVRLPGSERLVPVAQKRRAEGDDETVRLSRTILMKVLDERIGILSADAANDARFSASESISSLKLHSMMCVPLLDLQGNAFGVINLDTQNPMKRFTDEDLELLMAVASQAANAYENVRLLKSHLEKQKQDEEMKIARSVQKALLPEVLPAVPGWYFFASYDAAQAVGGDY
ncbi:MAG: FHA domain-containing protein, partial [Planctomycetaceae bacterium]